MFRPVAHAPPISGRSVNPISTRQGGGHYALTVLLRAPSGFSDLATVLMLLLPLREDIKCWQKYHCLHCCWSLCLQRFILSCRPHWYHAAPRHAKPNPLGLRERQWAAILPAAAVALSPPPPALRRSRQPRPRLVSLLTSACLISLAEYGQKSWWYCAS